jgi:hypothetical protein
MPDNKILADTARRLAAEPVAATVLDQDALAVLSEIGLERAALGSNRSGIPESARF